MSKENTFLTYCAYNKKDIDKIVEDLSPYGATFTHDLRKDGDQEKTKRLMRAQKDPILLFISNEFLSSSESMNKALEFIQDPDIAPCIKPIMMGTLKEDEEYIKFWEEEYASLRARKDNISPLELETYNWRVFVIRRVSNIIAPFLNHLRTLNLSTLEEFTANNYSNFFRIHGIEPPTIGSAANEGESAVDTDIPEVPPAIDIPEVVVDPDAEPIGMEGVSFISGPVPPIGGKIVDKISDVLENIFSSEDEDQVPETPKEILEEVFVEETLDTSLNLVGDTPIETLTEEVNELSDSLTEITPTESPETNTEELTIEEAESTIEESPIIEYEESDLQIENLEEEPIVEEPALDIVEENAELDIPEELKNTEDIVVELLPELSAEELTEKTEELEAVAPEEPALAPEPPPEEELAADIEPTIDEAQVEEESVEEALPRELDQLFISAVNAANNAEPERAKNELELLLRENPDHLAANREMASLLRSTFNDPMAAVPYLEKIATLDPKDDDPFLKLGALYYETGDYQLSRNFYEKALEINPRKGEPHLRLGILITRHFKKQLPHAITHFEKAQVIDDKNPEVFYQYGQLLMELGDEKEAIKKFKKVKKVDKIHQYACFELAKIYYTLGKQKAASKAYESACIANPILKTKQNDDLFAPPKKSAESKKQKEAKEKVSKPDNKKQRKGTPVADNQRKGSKSSSGKSKKLKHAVRKMKKNRKPKDMHVLITGATAGIGLAIAQRFAKEGYNLILTGRRKKRLKEIEKKLEAKYKVKVMTLAFDVQDITAVIKFMSKLERKPNRIDILINNAGLAKGLDSFHEASVDHWETMIDTNIKGLLYMTRTIAPQMVARGSGHIINIGSVAGKEVYPKSAVYCATKHAVEALTKAIRMDLMQYNIKVSSVSPGHVGSEFSLVKFDGDSKKANDQYQGFIPLTPDEVAETVYFVASRSPNVNIQDVLMFSNQQASAVFIDRKEKKKKK